MARDLTVNGYSTVIHGAIENDLKYYLTNIGALLTPRVQEKPLGDIDGLVRQFLDEFGRRQSLDVHYGFSSPLVIDSGSVELIDWLAAMLSIRSWIGELTTSERTKIGSIRGILFERRLRAYLEHQSGGDLTFWPPRERPRSESERLRRRDVDLAVIVDDVMFLVECKVKIGTESSVAMTNALERGESWQCALWNSARKWLRQVDETAIAIAAGRATTDGHTLPAAIRFVVPLVCSPIVAYIRQSDPHYFLTPKIPRVCTPRELVELLTMRPSIALNGPAVQTVDAR
jgi:hypothetical protein